MRILWTPRWNKGRDAYFGADLRGARCAGVVPFGTTFLLEAGAETARVVSGAVDGGSSIDGRGASWTSFAGLPCVSDDDARAGDDAEGAELGALRRALRLACEDFNFVDGRFVPDLADDVPGVDASASSSMSSSSSSSSGSSSSATPASSPVSPLKLMNFVPMFASFTTSLTRNLLVRAGEAGLSPSSGRVDIWGASISVSLSIG